MTNRIVILLSFVLITACSTQEVQTNPKAGKMNYELVKRDDAKIIDIAPEFRIIEYGHFGNGLTNGTVAEVSGRYPLQGWGRNKVSDELVYVISGSGFLEMPDKKVALSAGDVAFVPKGQKIAWNGTDFKIFIPCIPAWTYEQHELID